MKLSAEQFTELAASFNARQSPTRNERRRAARMELQARVKITPVIAGRQLNPLEITICDFSARGVSLLHSAPMDCGQQFILELPRKGGGAISLLCVVAHSKSVGHNDFHRIGAEFSCALQPGQPIASDSQNAQEVQRIRESMLG